MRSERDKMLDMITEMSNWNYKKDKIIEDLQSQLDQANKDKMWLNAEIDTLKSEKENLMRTLEEASEELKGAVVLPVKIGDTIYVVPSETNYRLNIVNRREDRNKVYKYLVDEIRYNKYGFSIVSYIDSVPFYFNEKVPKNLCGHFDTKKYYGETWFTTRAEAQAKLQELRGGE